MLQAIISNNKLVAESLERAEPSLRRLCGKVAERVRAGGRIFCLGGDSPVPGAYPSPDGFFTSVALPAAGSDAAWQALQRVGATVADAVIAIDSNDSAAILAEGMRSCRRKGLLTACITANNASAAAMSAEYVVHLPLEVAAEARELKESVAKQMAMDALLTAVLAELGYIDAERGRGAVAGTLSESTLRAAETLMAQKPGIDRDTAVGLIEKYGSVRRAIKALNPSFASRETSNFKP